jgi:drug/metabolite transporter (DMT)-like permease
MTIPRRRILAAIGAVGALVAAALLMLPAQATQPTPAPEVSTTVLWTLGIGLAARTERQVTPVRVVGLLVGFAGALVILAPWNAPSPGAVGGALACLGAAASYGVSYVYMGRQLAGRGISPLVLSAAQLTAATGLLILVTPVAGLQPVQLTPAVLAAISILGALGTGAAYVLNYRLITDEGPTATSTVTYLLPVVAVALGIVFLGEPAAAHLLIGTGIVLVGIALVQGRTSALASTPEASTRELGYRERPGRAAPPSPPD